MTHVDVAEPCCQSLIDDIMPTILKTVHSKKVKRIGAEMCPCQVMALAVSRGRRREGIGRALLEKLLCHGRR